MNNFPQLMAQTRLLLHYGLYSDLKATWFEACQEMAQSNDPRLENYLWFANLYSDICNSRAQESHKLQGV